jgi:hypothetical protein
LLYNGKKPQSTHPIRNTDLTELNTQVNIDVLVHGFGTLSLGNSVTLPGVQSGLACFTRGHGKFEISCRISQVDRNRKTDLW